MFGTGRLAWTAVPAAALPRIAGESQTEYALAWFYGRSPKETSTTAQEIFINDVAARSGPRDRAVLARLVLDPRFDDIPEPALRTLIFKINPWLSMPLLETPYEYVAENEKKAVFGQWRKALQESVPRWK